MRHCRNVLVLAKHLYVFKVFRLRPVTMLETFLILDPDYHYYQSDKYRL